ncbi:12150_t:CDS:2 [Cetraspora pellucida]|uniref:12150_t:CDS:1 n=1 Tax=Cetraspora pellucida TaxID=1433469 RepID=A0ACA9NFR1_9GLOM|nr:12150_t:CDS:2 [Cetraspora pellucida]
MGTAFSMSNAFLLLFLNQELGASSIVLGLTGPLSAVAELLFFFYSKEGVMTAVYAGFGTGFGSLFGGILYDSAGGPRVMFGVVVGISIASLIMYWWGENGFKVNVSHFGGRRREPRFPWQDVPVGGGQINLGRSKSTLSIEVSRPAKKGRYELLSQDDDDEQYHYGIFGEGRL